MQNFQGIVFIWNWAYCKIFKSILSVPLNGWKKKRIDWIHEISIGLIINDYKSSFKNTLSILTPIRLGFLRLVFFGRRGVNLTSTSYFKNNLSNINISNNLVRLLNNLFNVCEKMLIPSVISWRQYIFCNKEMSKNTKNRWKSMKIPNIDRQILHIF